MPQISVIVPTHNRAAMIGEALDSVRAQTVTDWECIVVDDGGADDTRAIVEGLGDARFRYVWQENAKLPAARNNGVAQAHGDLLAFLDDDDVWLPRYLETVSALLASCGRCVMAAAARVFWDGHRDLKTQEFPPRLKTHPLEEIIRYCHVVSSQVMIPRRAWAQTGGFGVYRAEDYDLWLQLLARGPAAFTDEPLVRYRLHPQGSQVDTDGRQRRIMTEAQIAVYRKFLRRGDLPPYVRLLAYGNLQRTHEQMLEVDMQQGRVPAARLARLGRLLSIVPSPLLRNRALARQYLGHRGGLS